MTEPGIELVPRDQGRDTTTDLVTYFSSTDVYLFGPTGVGKTELSAQISGVTPIRYVSLGQISRNAIAAGDQDVIELTKKGGKWPLSAVQKLLVPHIADDSSFVLDGAPRHLDEARWLADEQHMRNHQCVAVVLDALELVIERRRAQRDNSQRPETLRDIKDRIATYKRNQHEILQVMGYVLDDIIQIDSSLQTPHETLEELARRI